MVVAFPHVDHAHKAVGPVCATRLTPVGDAPRQRPTAYALAALFMLL
ncbi:paraquat-inducible protein A, partial [Enterobacter sichuanensis]